MQLREWTTIYLKQRDLIKREINSLEETTDGLIKHKKDGGEETIIIAEELKTNELMKKPAIICCLNTKTNLKTLQDNWEAFAAAETLTMIFANPDQNEQWLLKPRHHQKIADPKTLREGLITMSENISIM